MAAHEELVNPGRIYEAPGEPESPFVIFYEDAHNKPVRSNVKHVFDNVGIIVKGNHVGGPFTDLVRQGARWELYSQGENGRERSETAPSKGWRRTASRHQQSGPELTTFP